MCEFLLRYVMSVHPGAAIDQARPVLSARASHWLAVRTVIA